MVNLDSFITYVNTQHPKYEGSAEDGIEVKVILSKWYNDSGFGSGFIYPFHVPSMYNDTVLTMGVLKLTALSTVSVLFQTIIVGQMFCHLQFLVILKQ
jgi:hypothetical protein